jgi:hypothetical protein
MPVKILPTKEGFQVRTPNGIKAKHTTLAKAKKQRNLLNALEHDPNFKMKKSDN